MTPEIKEMLSRLDRAAVQRATDELRNQLTDCENLLAILDRIDATSTKGHAAAAQTEENTHHDHTNGNGLRRLLLTEKRRMVLAILRERPGRWTTRDMAAALAERGIDPDAGTPPKNLMWQLAKAGELHAAGSGVYEYPPLHTPIELAHDEYEQEAMAA